MPNKIINDSPNIAVLDSKIEIDLCGGNFNIDLSPSTWIASGADNVVGAKVQITNPYGVVVRPYPSGYDIAPPMTDQVVFAIPTQAGNYQYGLYKFDIQLTDDGGNTYIVSKSKSICPPDANHVDRKYGSLSASLKGVCKDGKVYVIADTPPNYNGAAFESSENAFKLEYPTSSGLDPFETTIGNLSTQLYEGVYKFTGERCVTYNYGDNITILVNYKVKRIKNILCVLDECCIFTKLIDLNKKINTDCSVEEKELSVSITIDTLRLLKTIQLSAECGEDPSELIEELEDLLGCKCTCNCNEGTPIIPDSTPTNDFVIEGCNIESSVDGNTKTYTINNYEYVVEITENGGALTVSNAVLDGCTKTQTFTLNVQKIYNQIVEIAQSSSTQSIIWAGVINKTLDKIDASCLGVEAADWEAMDFGKRIETIISKICTCCNCDAVIDTVEVSSAGGDVFLVFTYTDADSVDIYLDGKFIANVLAPITEYTLVGAADGEDHTYKLIPKCGNKNGTIYSGEFGYLSCPTIPPPVVADVDITDVCPFDLTTLPDAEPAGITYEWHNADDTSSATLVPDPTAVTTGNYWIFAKDVDGCYSIGIKVQIICSVDDSCSAPQNLSAKPIIGGTLIKFQSAAYPPPGNSYTVKRRHYSDPDTGGSYTTIGTPAWNSSSNRWEILDTTAVDDTLYVYRAVSNCSESAPYIDYTFGKLSCPDLDFNVSSDTVEYSFTPGGADITKYEVSIYDATGMTLIHTDTYTPAFSNPISGSFTGLDADTPYMVKIKAFVGTFSQLCAGETATTDAEVYYFYNATQYECPDCETPVGEVVVASTDPDLTLDKFYKFIDFVQFPHLYLISGATDDPGTGCPIVINTPLNTCEDACAGEP